MSNDEKEINRAVKVYNALTGNNVTEAQAHQFLDCLQFVRSQHPLTPARLGYPAEPVKRHPAIKPYWHNCRCGHGFESGRLDDRCVICNRDSRGEPRNG